MKKSLFILPLLNALFSCNTILSWQSNEHTDVDGDALYSDITELRHNHKLYAYLIDQSDTLIQQKNICGFPVFKELGRLDTYHLNVIDFLISDSTAFIRDYQPIKQPFYPLVAIKKEPADKTTYLFSLGTEEIAVSHNDSTYITYKIADIDNFNRFCNSLIHNLNKN